MSRQLVITVGTSLFHSATWEPQGVLESISGYDRWADPSGEYFLSPRRRDRDERVGEALRELLEHHDPRSLLECLPAELRGQRPPRRHAMRYSAELATLILLASRRECTLEGLLAGYDRVTLTADPMAQPDGVGEGTTWVAARHLAATLETLAGDTEVEVRTIDGLSSASARELEEALGKLLRHVHALLGRAVAVDVVATGGFKVYGLALARLLCCTGEVRLELHYIHEAGDELVSLDRGRLQVGERELRFGHYGGDYGVEGV